MAVHCAERGHLMAQIWVSNMELFERLSQLLTNAKLQMVLQNDRVRAERAQLLKRVHDMEAELETRTVTRTLILALALALALALTLTLTLTLTRTLTLALA